MSWKTAHMQLRALLIPTAPFPTAQRERPHNITTPTPPPSSANTQGITTYPDNVLVDHNKADEHGHVGQHGKDGQDLEILDEGQQHHKRQQGQHVEPGVHGGCEGHRPVGLAVSGGAVGRGNNLGKHRNA